ncbi:MAG: heavy metal-responsive transcriptional regulator [Deltaproteobacteria bacterium]|nr:heavy metal-responsive transcriptional regulator [Deltaproteobacteria bacterium]
MKENDLTIGKVARLTAAGIETIRFYERQGLIPAPPRRDSGYRQYPSATIERVRFIKRAKDLGFTLAEIKELLDLSVGPKATCAAVKRKADEKINEVDAKITDLKRIKRALSRLTAQCRGKGPISECPILENLKSKESKGGVATAQPLPAGALPATRERCAPRRKS